MKIFDRAHIYTIHESEATAVIDEQYFMPEDHPWQRTLALSVGSSNVIIWNVSPQSEGTLLHLRISVWTKEVAQALHAMSWSGSRLPSNQNSRQCRNE